MNNDANDGATKAPSADENKSECLGRYKHAWTWGADMFKPGAELDPSTNVRKCSTCGLSESVTLGGKLAQ